MKEKIPTLEEIKHGYQKCNNGYRCTTCGKYFSDLEVYPLNGRYLLAGKAVKQHVDSEHGDVFHTLLSLDKKDNTLTEVQKNLFRYIKEGRSDKEIAALTNTSPSTIRHQRFIFKEKAKQAKYYLALYELVSENRDDDFIEIHKTAKQIDDRYLTTKKEEQQVLETMFTSLTPLKLKQIPAREKKKIIVLRRIIQQLQPGKRYAEQELNEILKDIHEDFATIRRYLIEYGYLDRTNDCKEYWIKEA